jgi:hypothetical protein
MESLKIRNILGIIFLFTILLFSLLAFRRIPNAKHQLTTTTNLNLRSGEISAGGVTNSESGIFSYVVDSISNGNSFPLSDYKGAKAYLIVNGNTYARSISQ